MLELITNVIGVRALAIIAAALLITCIAMGVIVEVQGAKLDTATAKNKTLTVQLQGVGNQITAQNAAVEQMRLDAAAQHERLLEAQKQAGQIRVVTKERIEYIEHSEIPTPCPDAVIWGAAHAIEIGKRWEAANAVQ